MSEWNDFIKTKPEDKKNYLCVTSKGNYIVATYLPDTFKFKGNRTVLYWTELPELPEGLEDNTVFINDRLRKENSVLKEQIRQLTKELVDVRKERAIDKIAEKHLGADVEVELRSVFDGLDDAADKVRQWKAEGKCK